MAGVGFMMSAIGGEVSISGGVASSVGDTCGDAAGEGGNGKAVERSRGDGIGVNSASVNAAWFEVPRRLH